MTRAPGDHSPGERPTVLLTSFLAGVIAFLALLGRVLDIELLHSPVPHGGDLRVESALALGGLALAAAVRAPRARAVAALSALAVASVDVGGYLGVTSLPVGESRQMPLATAICVLLLVPALAVPRRPVLTQVTAIAAGAIGGLVIVGFAYGTRTLARFSDSSMSVTSAAAVVLLAAAILAGTPGGWYQWIRRGSDAGAAALRRTLPFVVLGMPTAVFLHIQAEKHIWKDERVAHAALATLVVILVSAQLFRVASFLRSMDLQRDHARRDLVAINARLLEDMQHSYASLRSAQQRIGSLENAQRQVLTAHDDVLQTIFASGLMLRTNLPDAAEDPSVQRTLDCLDDAVRSIRQVVKDLDSHLGTVDTA